MITTQLDADGVLLATLDMHDRTMNVFSWELMDAMDALMDRVDRDPAVRAVVITSGKSSFLAGADLSMVRGFCSEARTASHERMFERCGRLGRQNVRLEASAKPWVAAVNGLALGGGLELAMSCRVRIVTDDPRIQLGVPEVRWGLLPGAGGTQRLPRFVGYPLAMDLLLTGRSLTPAEAVASGLFQEAVAADALIDRARQIALDLAGQAYDPAAKFPRLAQDDVPPHSAQTAREQALRFGISASDFERYPAYSAIVDSVLLGAHHPLAQANAIEMNQFLRLMFSAVAGRMVRTLFLERLRAERELVPAGVKVLALRHGALDADAKPWADALARLRTPCQADASLPERTLEVSLDDGSTHRLLLALLTDHTQLPAGQTAAVLAPAGPWGRVMEIVGQDAAAARAAAALAARMWTLPWASRRSTSLLQALRDQPLARQAEIATRWAATDPTTDLCFLDVAACLSGVTPGWAGGPLSWAWDEGQTHREAFDAATAAAWAAIAPRLEAACA